MSAWPVPENPPDSRQPRRVGDAAQDPTRSEPATVRIGITGHSDLSSPSLPIVRTSLREWLIPRAVPPWVGVSCLAQGADQLFAELVLALRGRLEVILPARDYRARKVAPDNLATFDRLVAAADLVSVAQHDSSSRQAYMSASMDMLAAVDLLVAVWDGRPAGRHGSTADVVDAAHKRQTPVSVIWPPAARRRRPARVIPLDQADPRATAACVATGPTRPEPRPPQPLHVRLAYVLDGLTFPAQRWEIVVQAERFGADHGTRCQLADLPNGTYDGLRAVLAALHHSGR